MAQKPKKRVVDSIIDNLLNSEIPEIQQVARQLTEWTKQLEEHSWKLQHYATELENLVLQESTEASEEVGLAELVRDLEKTLAELRQGTSVTKKTDKSALKEPKVKEPEKEQPPVTEKPEDSDIEPPVTDVKPSNEGKELVTAEEAKRLQEVGLRDEFYTTPEGFVVRKAPRR
jgi:myosin heavy subunit